MKKIIVGLVAASSLLLAACNEGNVNSIVGTPSTVGPVDFSEKEQAIIQSVNQTDQNFLRYEIGTGDKMVVKAYIYEDGDVSEQEVYLDKRSGIINAGFVAEGDKLSFKLDGITKHYGDSTYEGTMSSRTDEDVFVTKTPKLVATYYASFKEDGMLSTAHGNEQGEPYKKFDATKVDKDEIIIDIVAYIAKK